MHRKTSKYRKLTKESKRKNVVPYYLRRLYSSYSVIKKALVYTICKIENFDTEPFSGKIEII